MNFSTLKNAIEHVKKAIGYGEEISKYTLDNLYRDDVFIVSFPKSGNTWMRMLVGNYITGGDCTYDKLHEIIPDVHLNPEHIEDVGRPRFIKSHAPYRSEYPNVVYIVRDGRDVAVSFYHHCIKQQIVDPDTEFSTFLAQFNRGEIGAFGSWRDHISSWLDHGEDEILVVRYEDMLDDTAREFQRVLDFAGLNRVEKKIEMAVEASQFEKLQKQEQKKHDEVPGLEGSDSSKRFFRKGQSGDWENHFDESDYDYFIKTNKEVLDRLGYL